LLRFLLQPSRSNSISINELMDELATVVLASFVTTVRFKTRIARAPSPRAHQQKRPFWGAFTGGDEGIRTLDGVLSPILP
jgi:hypothetical protein